MAEEKTTAPEPEILPIKNDVYDPYANRDMEHATNDYEALAHISKGILGTGILALPEGFAFAGGLLAILFSLLSCFVCTVCIHIMVKDFYMVCKAFQRPYVSYADAMELGVKLGPPRLAKYSHAFGIVTNVFLIVFQGGVLCVYMLFVGVTMQTMINSVVQKDIHLACYLLVITIPCFLINCLKDLKYLAPVSYFSLLVTVFVICLIYYYALRDELPSYADERKLANDAAKVPIFFGTTLYAFVCVAVTVQVENNMLHPARFYMLYDIAIVVLTALYISVSFVSYWRWGDDVKSIVILNFPHQEVLARVGNYLYALAIFLSLGLNGFVPVKLITDKYMFKRLESTRPIFWEYTLRLAFIGFGLVLAVTIPYVGTMISLLGAITMSFLALIFPCVLDICCRYQLGYGKGKYILVIDIIIIIYGILGLVSGVYTNIKDLVEKIQAEGN